MHDNFYFSGNCYFLQRVKCYWDDVFYRYITCNYWPIIINFIKSINSHVYALWVCFKQLILIKLRVNRQNRNMLFYICRIKPRKCIIGWKYFLSRVVSVLFSKNLFPVGWQANTSAQATTVRAVEVVGAVAFHVWSCDGVDAWLGVALVARLRPTRTSRTTSISSAVTRRAYRIGWRTRWNTAATWEIISSFKIYIVFLPIENCTKFNYSKIYENKAAKGIVAIFKTLCDWWTSDEPYELMNLINEPYEPYDELMNLIVYNLIVN